MVKRFYYMPGKYQIGGDSTLDFNNLADQLIASQQDNNNTYQPEDQQDEQPQQEDSNPDYEELQNNYQDLSDKYQQLEQKINDFSLNMNGESTGDGFLDFLFSSDNSNLPLNFDSPSFSQGDNGEDQGVDPNYIFGDRGGNEGGGRGSIAETNNNPGNLKFADWMRKYGAVPGTKSKDGDFFAKFPDVNSALMARKELLRKPLYANKTVNDAMKLYSNSGYDGSIYPEIKNKQVGKLTDKEIEELTKRQVRREDQSYAKKLGFQNGGKYAIASTPEDQYEGLNNDDYDQMYFPNDGYNTFRGLDDNQPVMLQDELGKQLILRGRNQTASMYGNVFESRL